MKMEVFLTDTENHKKVLCRMGEREKEDQVTEKMMRAQKIEGLLEMVESGEKGSYLYSCDGLITVRDFLETERKKEQILKLLQNLCDTVKEIHAYMIPEVRLIFDPQWIFVDPDENWTYFVCLPFQAEGEARSLLTLFLQIAEGICPDRTMTHHYLDALKEKLSAVKEPQVSRLSELLGECSRMEEEEIAEIPPQGLETVVWNNMRGMLIRRRNSQNYMLDKSEVVIGKDYRNVDFYITENPTVSRRHALIENEKDKYFLSDLHSTNHTYVNGKMVQPGEKVELKGGDILLLSNEEFLFQMV